MGKSLIDHSDCAAVDVFRFVPQTALQQLDVERGKVFRADEVATEKLALRGRTTENFESKIKAVVGWNCIAG
jgi:hypothetical protein